MTYPAYIDPPVRYVLASGTARADVPADRAMLLVRSEADGPTRARALARLRTSRTRLTRVLTRFDATVSHTRTLASSLDSPREEQGPWQARTIIALDIADLTALTALQTALLKISGLRIAAPHFTLRAGHPAIDSVRREAVREAAHRARTLADASGHRITELVELTESSAHPAQIVSAETGPAGTAEFGTTVILETGRCTVSAQVTARYRVAEPPPARTG